MTPADDREGMQDEFLGRLRREGASVAVYLTNGKRLAGRLKAHDRFTVLLESGRAEQLIFKHAISTIAPEPPEGEGPGRR